jgi:hypothetical protein
MIKTTVGILFFFCRQKIRLRRVYLSAAVAEFISTEFDGAFAREYL